jgi:hypothetical protein
MREICTSGSIEQAERLSSDVTTVRYRIHGTIWYIASQTSAEGSQFVRTRANDIRPDAGRPFGAYVR